MSFMNFICGHFGFFCFSATLFFSQTANSSSANCAALLNTTIYMERLLPSPITFSHCTLTHPITLEFEAMPSGGFVSITFRAISATGSASIRLASSTTGALGNFSLLLDGVVAVVSAPFVTANVAIVANQVVFVTRSKITVQTGGVSSALLWQASQRVSNFSLNVWESSIVALGGSGAFVASLYFTGCSITLSDVAMRARVSTLTAIASSSGSAAALAVLSTCGSTVTIVWDGLLLAAKSSNVTADSLRSSGLSPAAAVGLVAWQGNTNTNGPYITANNGEIRVTDSNVTALGGSGAFSTCAAVAIVSNMGYYNPFVTWIRAANLSLNALNSNVTALGGGGGQSPTGSVAILCSSVAYTTVSAIVDNCSFGVLNSTVIANSGRGSDSPAAGFAVGAYISSWGAGATASATSLLLTAINSNVLVNASTGSASLAATVGSNNLPVSFILVRLVLCGTNISSIGPAGYAFAAFSSRTNPASQGNVSLYIVGSNIESWGCLFAMPQGNALSVLSSLNCSCNRTGWAPAVASQLTGMSVTVNNVLWNATGPGLPFTGIVWTESAGAYPISLCELPPSTIGDFDLPYLAPLRASLSSSQSLTDEASTSLTSIQSSSDTMTASLSSSQSLTDEASTSLTSTQSSSDTMTASLSSSQSLTEPSHSLTSTLSPVFFATLEDEPALPIQATQATEIGHAISTTASVAMALGNTQIAQGVRANSILQFASCNDVSGSKQGSLSWMDSPTRLSIGNNLLQYDVGAIIGNWALLGGTSMAWALTAYRFGTALTRFPGGLTIPVLLLMSPTITSAVSLLRDGTVTQQLLGGCSLTAQVIGTGLVAVFLHPSHFGARWDVEEEASKWIDGREKNYVKHYGMLFKDYREGRHWFITGELLMSIAMGALKSYLPTEGNCKPVVTAAAAVSLAYALSFAVLRPNIEPKERVFYGTVSGAMAAALTLQAASLWSTSKDVQQKTRAAAESIVMAAEWALFAKSLYDVSKRLGSLYHYFRPASKQHDLLGAPLLPIAATQQDSAPAVEMQSINVFVPAALSPVIDEMMMPLLDVPIPDIVPTEEESGSPLEIPGSVTLSVVEDSQPSDIPLPVSPPPEETREEPLPFDLPLTRPRADSVWVDPYCSTSITEKTGLP